MAKKKSSILYDISRKFYKAASTLNDLENLANGDIDKLIKKQVRKQVYKQTNKVAKKINNNIK